jgi:ribosomal protein L32
VLLSISKLQSSSTGKMLWNSLRLVSTLVRQRLTYYRPALLPSLATTDALPQWLPVGAAEESSSSPSLWQDSWIWFAVPKRKHSKSRKRMKTTAQKRIPLKKNIIFDPRTGEVTLRHKLPFNWKDYLPKVIEG